MKQNIKYALLALFSFLMMSCQKSQEYYEGVYIVGADKLSPVANLTIDDLPAVIGIKVASSNAMGNNVEVMMKSTPEFIIRKSKFPQNPKRSVRFSGKRTKRSVQKRKARNTQKAETKVL